MRTTIRHLACSSASPIVAAALFERFVSVWNIESSALVSLFDTVLDFGGRRLALDALGTQLFVGSYSRRKLVCYDVSTGKVLWERTDLGSVQQVSAMAVKSRVVCGVAGPKTYILDAATGKTIDQVSQAEWLLRDTISDAVLIIQKPARLIKPDGTILTIGLETFGILDAEFGDGSVVISEATGDVRCISVEDGREKWRYVPCDGRHVLSLSYFPKHGKFYALEGTFLGSETTYNMLKLEEESGHAEVIKSFGTLATWAFSYFHESLCTNNGSLFEVRTGEIVRHLPFEEVIAGYL